MKVLERIDGPFGGIDERAMTNQLEEEIGNIDRCFRLMRIYDNAVRIANASSNPMRMFLNDEPKTVEEVFNRKAKEDRYTQREIDAYMDYRSVV